MHGGHGSGILDLGRDLFGGASTLAGAVHLHLLHIDHACCHCRHCTKCTQQDALAEVTYNHCVDCLVAVRDVLAEGVRLLTGNLLEYILLIYPWLEGRCDCHDDAGCRLNAGVRICPCVTSANCLPAPPVYRLSRTAKDRAPARQKEVAREKSYQLS